MALLLAVVTALCGLPLAVFAADSTAAVYDTEIETELADYLLYQTTYVDSAYVGATAKVSVYADTAKDGKAIPTDVRDAIVYVKNWNGERIGTESDVSIVKSYVEAAPSVETENKAVVIVVDYGYSGGDYAKNSVVGKIEFSIGNYRKSVLADGKLELAGSNKISINKEVVYILPEGYRVTRDILFWESDFHSSKGTLNSVLNAWNNEIANPKDNNYRKVYYDYYVEGDEIPAWEEEGTTVGSPKHDEQGNIILYDSNGDGTPDQHGAPKVTRVEDCRQRYGEPMDYNVRLDVIHPAFEKDEDKVETPVFMVACTQSPRTTNILDGNRNYFGSFTFDGCTGAIYDYAYIPTARIDHYGYNDQYGTHEKNAAKWSRAAVRCLKYYAGELGYSDELIAVAGISKGTPTTSILSLNHNELAPEQSYYDASNKGTIFEGGENIYQPYSTYEGGYDGKGGNPAENPATDMTKTGAVDSNVTVVYSAAGDGINWQYQNTSIRKHIEQYGNVPMALSCGYHDEYGCWDHYDDIVASKGELATSVYLSIPMEDKGHEYPNGYDTIRGYDRYEAFSTYIKGFLLPDEYAPTVGYITPFDGAEDVAFDTAIEIQFIANARIEIGEVEANVSIKDSKGNEIEGTWSTDNAEYSNLFTFTPEKLVVAEEYTVSVSSDIKDVNGVKLAEGKTVTFATEGIGGSFAIADTYVSTAEPDKSFAGEGKLVVSRDANNENIALISFDSDIIENAGDLKLVLPKVDGTYPRVQLSVIDSFKVGDDSTYNSIKDRLSSAIEMSHTVISGGAVSISADVLTDFIKGEFFTFVLRADPAETHSFSQPFNETLYGFNGANTNEATVLEKEGITRDEMRSLIYSKFFDYSVGYNAGTADIKIAQDSERGTVGYTTRANGRYRFHNSISTRTLSEADLGRQFEVTFWMKAEKGASATVESTSVTYGLMRPKSSNIKGPTVTLSNTWTKYSFIATVDNDMLTVEENLPNNQQAMFAFVTPGNAGFTYYIDDITVNEIFEDVNISSLEGGDEAFVFTTTQEKILKPVKDAYVSTIYPDKNFGKNHSVLVTGGEDATIGLISFSTSGIAGADYAVAKIPVRNAAAGKVKVSYVKNYTIDETAITYNNAKSIIESAVSLGTYDVGLGTLKVDLLPIIDDLSDCFSFTLIIESADSATHFLDLDFEDYSVGDVLGLADTKVITTTYYMGDKSYLGARGYNPFNPSDGKAITIKADADGNQYGSVLTATSGKSRWGFFNGMNHRALTQDDLGKTFYFTAKLRLSEGYSAGSLTYAIRDWEKGAWLNSSNKTITFKDNNWVTVNLSYKITQNDIDGTVKPMFTIEFDSKNGSVGYDVDDVRVVTKNANGEELILDIGAYENIDRGDYASTYTINSAAYGDKVIADAYVIKDDANSYGTDDSLVLKGELGKNAVLFSSFSASVLEKNNLLKLPTEGMCDGQIISVAVADGDVIDESDFSYADGEAIIANAQFVGRYTLDVDSPYIDLSHVKDMLESKVFTLIMQADEKHEFTEDFENVTKTLTCTASVNAPFNENYVLRTGGANSNCKVSIASVEAGDRSTKVLKIVNGGMRYKLYNTMTDDYATVMDTNRAYNISYDVYTSAATSGFGFTSSFKAAYNGDGVTTGPAMGKTSFTQNDYLFLNKIVVPATTWQNVSYDVSIDPDTVVELPNSHIKMTNAEGIIKYQAFMLTFDTYAKTVDDYFYIDNIKVTEIGGNEGVTTSTFPSRESGKETMHFVSFDANGIELDEKVNVLETEVSLGDGVSEVFLLSADNTYTLLSIDGESGELYFTKDGERYVLCNADGEIYRVGEDSLPVAAIYDSEKGTVRYAVDGTLAYYKNGDELVNTYGLELVKSLESQSAKLGSVGGSLTVKASKAGADGVSVIGTQTGISEQAIRIVSGIDMLYYTQVGFVVECGGKETVAKSNTVFSSIEADGATVEASELGVGYLATLTVTELDSDGEIDGKTFTVTPVVNIGEVEIAGESVSYRISLDGETLTLSAVE